MATNIEIKAHVADPVALRVKVEAISGTAGQLIPQEDIFFSLIPKPLCQPVCHARHERSGIIKR